MKWVKKGLIYKPSGKFEWIQSFAQVPTPYELDDRLRIYFTTRPKAKDGMYVSYTSFIDVNKENPKEIIYEHDRPVLELGGKGDFDEFGIHPLTLIEVDDMTFFYYQGWTRMYSVPYSTSIGLAISKDKGLSFEKYSKGPLFSRTPNEPYLENGFFITRENNKFNMWYATAFEWIEINDNKMEPVYQIVYAESNDGIKWKRFGEPLLNTVYKKEANGRPAVIKIGEIYHMWFCYRDVMDFRPGGGGAYRIGYAYSRDKLNWIRDDSLAGIDLSYEGWDSQMIAYSYVIKAKNKLLMFYNGNEFGKHGFGYAELDFQTDVVSS